MNIIKSFYLSNMVYYVAGAAAVIYVLSYFFPAIYTIGSLLLLFMGIAILIDGLLVYGRIRGIHAHRSLSDRFSIGDQNKVLIHLENHYGFPARMSIIDELPVQFQERNWIRKANDWQECFL